MPVKSGEQPMCGSSSAASMCWNRFAYRRDSCSDEANVCVTVQLCACERVTCYLVYSPVLAQPHHTLLLLCFKIRMCRHRNFPHRHIASFAGMLFQYGQRFNSHIIEYSIAFSLVTDLEVFVLNIHYVSYSTNYFDESLYSQYKSLQSDANNIEGWWPVKNSLVKLF